MNGTPAGALLGAKPRSLRRRLIFWVSLATLLIYVLAALLSYRQARHEVQELMDGELIKTARLLLALIRDDTRQAEGIATRMAAQRGIKARRNELTLEFAVARSDGRELVRSQHAPEMPAKNALGFSTIEHRGHPWRTLILETTDGSHRAIVAQSIGQRDKEALEIAAKTVLPLAVLMPLLIALIYYSIRRGLKPLDDLAEGVGARSPENLAPLQPETALQETQPLIAALNRLFGRLAQTLDNERRFTADAAHELRTPLAALKVHAQVAMATRDAAQCREAVGKVIAGADRATRLVEQLLRLAQLDPLVALPDPQPVDLGALVDAAGDDATAAATRQPPLRAVTPQTPLIVRGAHDLLAAALRNLVDNALRYAPAGSEVTIRAAFEHGQPQLEVRDSGPGVQPAELPHLLERFYRGRDVTAEGSGLGLAIVQRIAELHAARLEVENLAGGGFAARLRWFGAGTDDTA